MENHKKSSNVTSKPVTYRSNFILVSSFLTLVILGLIGIAFLYKNLLPVKAFQPMKQDYPIVIQGIKIEKAETGWVKSAPSENKTNQKNPFLPRIMLRLSDDSTDGSFICYFANSDGNPVGDSFRITIREGNFVLTNSNAIDLTSFKGFKEAANYYAYRYETKNFWSFIINQIEPSGENKIIANIPIPPYLLKN